MTTHAKTRPKQAWEMTVAEVRRLGVCSIADLKSHRLIVEDALQIGKPVPMKVLEDYPSLMPSHGIA